MPETATQLPDIVADAKERVFPPFSLARLLGTVFEPTLGCRVCVMIDLDDPANDMKDYAFLKNDRYAVQAKAHEHFYLALQNGVMDELGMSGGDMIGYHITNGSNLDLRDECWDAKGNQLSLNADIYTNYDIILCTGDWSATAPLTAKCKEFGFRGATMHGLNDIILSTGLAVDYDEVSVEAEKMRAAMTNADSIEIDFTLEDGRVLTASLELDKQDAQKSHGLCKGLKPDVANLPAGEVYFVPTDANGEFPMKYADGTLGILTVKDRSIIRSELIEGNQATIDAHNARLQDDPMTGTLGELGFGTQVLPVSVSDIQDEKVLGTCHLATGRDDHLGGDIVPDMFKTHENSTHDDILFAPHKTPNFDVSQVRMKRGDQEEILIEHFRPAEYLLKAMRGA
jgi:aminopeptidase